MEDNTSYLSGGDNNNNNNTRAASFLRGDNETNGFVKLFGATVSNTSDNAITLKFNGSRPSVLLPARHTLTDITGDLYGLMINGTHYYPPAANPPPNDKVNRRERASFTVSSGGTIDMYIRNIPNGE